MDRNHIENFAKILQPSKDKFGFLKDIKQPISYHFQKGHGCDAGVCNDCLSSGIELESATDQVPETALISLRRVLKAKGIYETKEGYPVRFRKEPSFGHEEFQVKIDSKQTAVTAADEDGFRRAVYFLEDRICEAEGASITPGSWRRKPFVKHRISRCFFGPTNRPPYFIDELMNDVNYYPEEYLNKLAHEGINGLWLTMYFKDLPSSIFPGRGKDAPKRLKKLKLTVERCARYGVRIYLFFSEPKYFGDASFAMPFSNAENHPELIGDRDQYGLFCVSSDTGKKYIEESVSQIFGAVPELGGIINIMLGEDNGTCVSHIVSNDPLPAGLCPVCSKRHPADIYREYAECFTKAMHKYNPNAEFIGWFYAPGQRDGTNSMKKLLQAVEKWPDDATLMFNFESGGTSVQLDRKRVVFDYSLAYVGPSQLFAESTRYAKHTGAKLQVGCSHEDASVPFVPVPENLYDKYKFMCEHDVSAAMQCWYFGNYPGLMNKAAGMLSFEPFPSSAKEFLCDLARPDWQSDAEKVAEAWDCFSRAYRLFPSNVAFEWYGPLHNSIVWPLHLFPVDEPIAPSWVLKNFPEVSGDRIGECLSYLHTLPEALSLCIRMSNTWEKGLQILKILRPVYQNDPPRLADIDLAEAVGLQMKSTVNLLHFYSLREDMIYNREDHLSEMKSIVQDEIANTQQMKVLCERDSRLGYHSEAEGYLFFPEKLETRIALLNELLSDDFPRFDLNADWIDEYTGLKSGKKQAVLRKNIMSEKFTMTENTAWCGCYDDEYLYLRIQNVRGKNFSIELAPCRMWAPVRFIINSHGKCYAAAEVADEISVAITPDGNDLDVRLSLSPFTDFRRPGFPMQFNISGDDFYWVKPEPWPSRLCYGTFNPNTTGWLWLHL